MVHSFMGEPNHPVFDEYLKFSCHRCHHQMA
jgi:hypothetical protein